MYEQFCVRPDAVKEKDPEKVRIDKNDMYTGMGIVRALPGPVFSIASFMEGINAVVVGIMIASTFYLMKDISLLDVRLGSLINAIVIAGTFTLLHYTKIPPPFIVIGCLLLGYIF
jgi:chromate transporter